MLGVRADINGICAAHRHKPMMGLTAV